MAAKIASFKISDILIPQKRNKSKNLGSNSGHDKAGAMSKPAGGAGGQKGVKPKSAKNKKR